MRPIIFRVAMLSGLPGTLDGAGVRTSPETRASLLNFLLDALGHIDDAYLAAHPATLPLYQSGVYYREEDDSEDWRDTGSLYETGWGDCEDVASARAAELRRDGIAATAFAKWSQSRSGAVVYHIVVARDDVSRNLPPPGDRFLYRLGDTWVEDPSAVLGMK